MPGTEQTLVILGASGDLTARLLLPGLGGLLRTGDVGEVSLIGSSSADWGDDRWRDLVEKSFGARGGQLGAVVAGTRYVQADATEAEDVRRLLGEARGTPILYFALPPSITQKACEALTGVELPDGAKLVFEKPFGTGVESAEALNALVARLVPEERVHRVDHFLGTATVLNILGLRFANRIVEPLLTGEHVESVDLVFDESLGLEGRAGYYDGAGALEDMIQSHMLEVLSLFAMEPPPTLGDLDVRDGKAQVLRATRVWDDDPVESSRRGRYTAGEVDGRRFPAYVDEEGVDPARGTETFAELALAVDTWRWAGVPFRVRSGKAIGDPRTEITVTFKAPQRVPGGLTGSHEPARLRIGIGLESGPVSLELNVNGPGDPFEIDRATLTADLGPGELPPYGEVLKGILQGYRPLSVRGDMAVECWRIIAPVQQAWAEDRVPLQDYPAGSGGPEGPPPGYRRA